MPQIIHELRAEFVLDEKLGRLCLSLEDANARITLLQAKLHEDKEQAISARISDRKQLDAIGNTLTHHVCSMPQIIHELRAELEDGNFRITLLQAQLHEDKEQAISTRTSDREQLDAIGNTLTHHVRTMPQIIHELRAEFSIDEKLDRLRLSLEDANARITSLQDKLHENKEQATSSQTSDREQLDAIGSMLTHHVCTMPQIIHELRAEFIKAADVNHQYDKRGLFKDTKGIFVVGHARSGTSVLNDALNSSPDVWMFGEANFHFSGQREKFRSWYNEMHQSTFDNPVSKTTHCPNLLSEDATGEDYLVKLSKQYPLVGDGVAFRDETLGYTFKGFIEYQQLNFYTAHYICILRHPGSTLESARRMWPGADMAIYARSYLRTLLLIIDVHRVFPNSRIIIHEQVSSQTFTKLSTFLNADLSGGAALYNKTFQFQTAEDWEVAGLAADHRLLLDEAWRRLFTYYDPERLTLGNDGDTLQGWQRELRKTLRDLGQSD